MGADVKCKFFNTKVKTKEREQTTTTKKREQQSVKVTL